jgi:hypothetical protein
MIEDHVIGMTCSTQVEIANMPAHLGCHQTATAGRTVTTTTLISKGDIALFEKPYAHTIHKRYRSLTCDTCFGVSKNQLVLQHPCPKGCGIYYCSISCLTNGQTRHQRSCALRRQVETMPTRKKSKHNNNSKGAHSSLSLLLNISSSDAPIENLLQMMRTPTIKSRRQNEAAEATFRRLKHGPSTNANVDTDTYTAANANANTALQLEETGIYAEALHTSRLNAIGMFNEYGDEIGFSLSPVLAMVNHSCVPNCQQLTVDGATLLVALRTIQVGEELSYSYISLLGEDTQERKDLIRTNWEFECLCERCTCQQPADDYCATFDAEHVCFCGAVCLVVDRETGECVCNRGLLE